MKRYTPKQGKLCENRQGEWVRQEDAKSLQQSIAHLQTVIELQGPPRCKDLHHGTYDYHKCGEPCPVEQKIKRLIAEAIEKAGGKS